MYTDRTLAWVILLLAAMAAMQARASAAVFSEDFSTGGDSLPPSWTAINRSSPPGEFGWTQGPMFTDIKSRSGDRAFAAVSWETAGPGGNATASAWLISSPIDCADGQTLSFATRAFETGFPDRLQVRLNVTNSGTDVGPDATTVGDFTRLLLDINPGYASQPDPEAFPLVWTTYSVPITGLSSPTTGRIAFRYFVEDAGPDGSRGGEIGLDDVVVTSAPEPASVAVLAGLAGALVGRRPRNRG